MTILRTSIVAALAAILMAAFAASAFAHNGQPHPELAAAKGQLSVGITKLPASKPRAGLVYDGLRVATSGVCKGALKLGNTNRCTHGPDPAPEGFDVKVDVAPIALPLFFELPKVQCDGNGTSGKRVQVIYARSSDKPDRYGTFVNSIRQWAADADAIYRNSAAETAGERHIRFVHDGNCVVNVANAVMTATGDDNFTNTQNDLKALGYNSTSRKYMVFVDANVYCGIGNIKNDDSPGAANLNNGGPSYGRTDAGCWGGPVAAHELMHNLGGVQLSAPNTSGGWHCVDEYDRMCYSDSPNYPAMNYVCNNVAHDKLFDCNHNDYFHTNPASGYLTTHWNAANSQYLVAGSQPVWGYVWANEPSSASYTPSTSYQRNSTGATNTITRSGVGVYQVTFTNLGVYYGGTVNVTAYGSGSEACKVASWGPSLADMKVNVRCFAAGGAAADTMFTASFDRPTSSSKFGYVWANNPTSASYTPSSYYRFNSTGAANTITRSGVGAYQVTFPGLGSGTGATVKVTAYGSGSETCKVASWGSSGTGSIVNVRCHNAAGAPVDTYYTVTFHGPIGLLGRLTDASSERAFLWANNASSASYTPSASYSFNSSGGVNTVTRSGVGVYQAQLPGLANTRGHVQVTAYGTDSSRCKVASWGWSGSTEVVNVRCHTAAGAPVDTRFALSFVD